MRLKRLVACLIVFLGFHSIRAHGQVVATWTDSSGNWSNAANWSTNPVVPNNGGGVTYSVTINTLGSNVTMDVLDDTVSNLTLGASDSLTINTGNWLGSGATSNSGGINNYGTLYDGTLNSNSGASLTNYGTIDNSGGTLNNNSGALLTNFGGISTGGPGLVANYGTFINSYGASLGGTTDPNIINTGAGAYFGNFGTIILYDSGNISNSGTFNNSGTIGGTASFDPIDISNSGTFNNTGTISVIYSFYGFEFNNSGTFNNTGTISLPGGCPPPPDSPCVFNSNMTNTGVLNNSGTLNTGGFSNFINSGTINNILGGLLSNGTTLNNIGGTIYNDFTSTITNTGTINNAAGANLINFGTLNNAGTLNNLGTLTNALFANLTNSGTINNTGNFTNLGAVIISSSGLFTTSTNYTQLAGSTLVNGTLTATGSAIVNIRGGALGGNGTINGNVLMSGTIMPGGTLMPGDSPGTLTIFGSYEQTGLATFDELMSPLSQSLLDVNGNVTLDPGALLEITLLNGFNPFGQTFDIMNYSALSGEFLNGSSFWDDGYLWDVDYGQNQIDITAVKAPEPGTFTLLAVGLIAFIVYSWRKQTYSLLRRLRRTS